MYMVLTALGKHMIVFAEAIVLLTLFTWAYVKFTPYNEIELIRESAKWGNLAHMLLQKCDDAMPLERGRPHGRRFGAAPVLLRDTKPDSDVGGPGDPAARR